MYFSRIRMTRNALPEVLTGSEYALHRAVWSLFADRPDRERDFLYRRTETAGLPEFLCLSARPPLARDGFAVQTKPFAPKLRQGLALDFAVRVNPVRTEWVNGHQKRHDVVMDHKKKLEAQGVQKKDRPRESVLAQQAGAAWFLARAERLGVEVEADTLRAEGYSLLDFTKTGRGERRRVRLATLDISGVLVVRDPALLEQALRQGVGPAKGFGCGLLLLKPHQP